MKTLLALVLVGLAGGNALAADRVQLDASVPSYRGSRFYTHKLNPLGTFGLARFIGARGLLGRIKAGTVDVGALQTDEKSIARISFGRGYSYQTASEIAKSVVASSRQGKFKDGGPTYPISRFFTSRIAMSVLGVVTGPGALRMLLGTSAERAMIPRALAGRIHDGKKLLESEKRLLAAIRQDTATLAQLERN